MICYKRNFCILLETIVAVTGLVTLSFGLEGFSILFRPRGYTRLLRYVLAAVVLFSFNVNATSLEEWSKAKLTSQSKSIHIGEVASSWSSYDPGAKMVFTYIRFKVEKTIKGGPSDEILIRQPGGQTKDFGTIVHGVARFAPHEKALVFLSSDRDGTPTVAGMTQGKFHISTDLKTGEPLASYEPPPSVRFFSSGKETSPKRTKLPLSDLVKEIEGYVKAEGTSPP